MRTHKSYCDKQNQIGELAVWRGESALTFAIRA